MLFRSTAGFELFVSPLSDPTISTYVPVSRYPKVAQDLTLRAPARLPYQALEQFILANLSPPKNSHYSLEPIEIYRKQGDDTFAQTTFRLSISSYERTLLAEEVNAMLDEVASAGEGQEISRI